MVIKIKNFIDKAKAASSSLIGISVGYILKKYFNSSDQEGIVFIIAITFMTYLLIILLQGLVSRIVENWVWLRKVILGKKFIEGYWMQQIADESLKDRPALYSIVYIYFDEDSLYISGESYDSNGNFTANFHSTHSEYKGSTMKYPFTVQTLESVNDKIFGISKLTFTITSKTPIRYTGFVSSNLRSKPVMVIGKKLIGIKHLELNSHNWDVLKKHISQ